MIEDPTARHMRLLQELAEIGMNLARSLERQVLDAVAAENDAADEPVAEAVRAARPEAAGAPATVAEPAARSPADPTRRPLRPAAAAKLQSFLQVAREVRLAVALEAAIYHDHCARRQARAAAEQAAEAQRKERLKSLLTRVVVNVLRLDAEIDRNRVEPLKNLLYSRIHDDDLAQDLGVQPIGALIARVCRDLRIDPHFEWWREEYWALEEARTGPPGSPYVEPRWRS